MDRAYADAVARLDRMQADLHAPATSAVDAVVPPTAVEVGVNHAYRENVEAAKEYIRAGDAFQIVLSQRFHRPSAASAFDVYRALRMTNPSPYMYLLNIPGPEGMDTAGFSIVGLQSGGAGQTRGG